MPDDTLLELETVVLVGVGGFAGANLRFFVDRLLPGLGGTLLVNVAGSFLLGLVLYEALFSGRFGERTRTVVGTGFLASFTTYSTFVVQTLTAPGLWPVANLLASYALGFGAVLAARPLAAAVVRADDADTDAAGGVR